MKLVAKDNPERGQVWVETEHGRHIADLDMSNLTVPEALMMANRFAAVGEAEDVLRHINEFLVCDGSGPSASALMPDSDSTTVGEAVRAALAKLEGK